MKISLAVATKLAVVLISTMLAISLICAVLAVHRCLLIHHHLFVAAVFHGSIEKLTVMNIVVMKLINLNHL